MNRQQGVSSLALVLLLLLLGSLMLAGVNQQLDAFMAIVSSESQSVQRQAAIQSALEWGRMQNWSLQPDTQCRQYQQQWRVCLRLTGDDRVLLIAGNNDALLWRRGEIQQGSILFSPHGWSDFCPLKENALCQLP